VLLEMTLFRPITTCFSLSNGLTLQKCTVINLKPKTVVNSKQLLKKVKTMKIIAKCLPASKSDLCEKVRDQGIRSRVTVNDRLNDLIELGFVRKGRCPTCNHQVYELYPWQNLMITKDDGSIVKNKVFIIKNGELDEFLFEAALFGRIKCRVKQREKGKKAKVAKKNLTVEVKGSSFGSPVN
jgi:hypothetical protein